MPYIILVAGLVFTVIISLVHTRGWFPYILAAGILVTLLFFGVTRSQIRARNIAERSDAEKRKSQEQLRQTLEERKRAEDAVREGEERYRELVENANDIVFTLDLQGNVTSINKAVESLTGFTQAELLRRT